jgi:hypothetical protein
MNSLFKRLFVIPGAAEQQPGIHINKEKQLYNNWIAGPRRQ